MDQCGDASLATGLVLEDGGLARLLVGEDECGLECFGGLLYLWPAIDCQQLWPLKERDTHVAPEISGASASAMLGGIVLLLSRLSRRKIN